MTNMQMVGCPCVGQPAKYSDTGPDLDGSPIVCEWCEDVGEIPSWLHAMLEALNNARDAGAYNVAVVVEDLIDMRLMVADIEGLVGREADKLRYEPVVELIVAMLRKTQMRIDNAGGVG